MGGVQADIPDGDIRVDCPEFPEGDNGADAVVPSGVEETDMQGQVNAVFRVMGAEHVKGVSEIIDFFLTVPAPVGIGVREMPFTRAVGDAVIHTLTDFMPVRGSMGMDTSAIAGKGEPALGDEPVAHGREDGGKAENLLEPFFKMEREFRVFQGVGGHGVRNAGVLIGEFFAFAGFFRRLCVFVLWEKVFPAGALGGFVLSPEPVHEIEIRSQRRERICGAASEGGKETVGFQPAHPGGQAGKTEQHHEDKRADNLCLVLSGPAERGIELGQLLHDQIQVQQAEFFPDRGEFEAEPCTLGRIKMYFCLMQEIEILLMGLPVNQHMCVLLWCGEK